MVALVVVESSLFSSSLVLTRPNIGLLLLESVENMLPLLALPGDLNLSGDFLTSSK